MHPGQRNSSITWSFHNPLSFYANILKINNFAIEEIEEWSSDKISLGRTGRMENRARNEIPLFMAIKAFKKD
jgi:hypothetical protein